MMNKRELGRTGLMLSVVGFGTSPLRFVPQRQSVETLLTGFQLGVNWVHTAPHYEGAEILVAKAVAEFGRDDIMVLSSSSGPVEHFGWTFNNTLRILNRQRLEMFGISAIDYCELEGLNVWGPNGLLEFLERRKKEGQLGGIFCTTHGSPEYIARLISSGRFDAILVAYNPLGFHVLSYDGKAEGKEPEDLLRNQREILPLANQHGVGLLVMKPLAGGLLCGSKAVPPSEHFGCETEPLTATDLIRDILANPEITAVVPGTASVEEARENALAGHASMKLSPDRVHLLSRSIAEMRASLCSRCGECETTCSESLPISWLFREGYLWSYLSKSFSALDRKHYFRLHPDNELKCLSCAARTCRCPAGIDIPDALQRVHSRMLTLRDKGLIHPTREQIDSSVIRGDLHVAVIYRETPSSLAPSQKAICRFWLENAGRTNWFSFATQPHMEESLVLSAFIGRRRVSKVRMLHDVGPGQRTHFSFSITAPHSEGSYRMHFALERVTKTNIALGTTVLYGSPLEVIDPLQSNHARPWVSMWRFVKDHTPRRAGSHLDS